MQKEVKKSEVKKGAWSKEEDALLRNCVEKHGEGKWYQVPLRAGLNRCKKSCRLRWMNYLRPNIKKGYFENDEIDLILRLHKLLGNRWSLIAGRLPGRTANDVKNFWNTHIVKKAAAARENCVRKNLQRRTLIIKNNIIRPQPRTLTISKLQVPPSLNEVSKTNEQDDDDENVKKKDPSSPASSSKFDVENLNKKQQPSMLSQGEADECFQWWRNLFELSENEEALICGHANNFNVKGGFNGLSVDDDCSEMLSFDLK